MLVLLARIKPTCATLQAGQGGQASLQMPLLIFSWCVLGHENFNAFNAYRKRQPMIPPCFAQKLVGWMLLGIEIWKFSTFAPNA